MSVDPVAISRSALDVEWQRMQIVAQNLANENTTGIDGKGRYVPLTLVSGPASGFVRALASGSRMPDPVGVRVLAIKPSRVPVREVYDPSHPAANSAGFVAYPNIDHAAEMVMLMRTARAYESNLTALGLAQQMSMRALEIGKR